RHCGRRSSGRLLPAGTSDSCAMPIVWQRPAHALHRHAWRAARRRRAGRERSRCAVRHWRPFAGRNLMLSPLRLLLIVGALWWLARRLGWRRVCVACIAAATLLVVLTTPLGANALVRIQEARVPGPATCTGMPPQAVVVLSGGLV